MKLSRSNFFSIVAILIVGLISGCSDSDDAVQKASIIPAINPKFDTVSSVKKSTTPAGTYTTVNATYDSTSEKITFPENAIDAGGNYIKITGDATVNGASNTYTVMTYVANNSTSIAANELTTLAVAKIANAEAVATADMTAWEVALDAVIDESGLSEMDVIMPMTEMQRATLPNLVATMTEMAAHFVDTESKPFALSSLANFSVPNMDQIAWGAQLYDNWMIAPETAPKLAGDAAAGHMHMMKPSNKVQARAEDHMTSMSTGKQPANLIVKLTDGTELLAPDGMEHEGFRRFARCSQCHGWDQKGDAGGFKNRGRSDVELKNPATGSTDIGTFKVRPLPAAVDLTTKTTAYEMADVTQGATAGAMYANITTPITAATAAEAATAWNNKIDAMSDRHPDFTLDTATTDTDDGTVNDIVPSADQVMALVAYLNYDGGKPEHLFSDFSNGQYTIKTMAMEGMSDMMAKEHMIEHGEEHYAMYCFRCHGAPNNEHENILTNNGGNLIGYLTKEGATELNHTALGAVSHFARWGKSGAVMNRARIGAPTAHEVANTLAYLEAYQTAVAANETDSDLLKTDADGNKGMGDAAVGKSYYANNCSYCHAASAEELTASSSSGNATIGEDKAYRCHKVETVGDKTTETTVAPESDGVCAEGLHTIPNLAHGHFKMTNDMGEINTLMEGKTLTQQNINDLAAFFASLHMAE